MGTILKKQTRATRGHEGIVSELPPCPDIMANIGRELRRKAPDLQRIAGQAARDIGCSSILVKAVNTGALGAGTPVRSVHAAIARLGLGGTSSLLGRLVVCNDAPSSPNRAMDRFWTHATQIALTTGFFAHAIERVERDEAHTFGLFRDAGAAVLLRRFDDYDPAAGDIDSILGSCVTDREKLRYGADHAVIGAVFARDCALPPEMCDAILWHHADFVLDLRERTIADAAVDLIALGVLGDRALNRYRGGVCGEAAREAAEAALRVLGLGPLQHADLELGAITMLAELEGRPMPTMRLTAVPLT